MPNRSSHRHPVPALRPTAAFTLLELVVAVIVIGVLALLAVPALRGVVDESTAAVASRTAESVARDATALAGSNTGASTNIVSNANIDAAVADTTLLTESGWSTSTDAPDGASLTLTRSGTACAVQISAVDGRAVVATPSCTEVAAGTTTTTVPTGPAGLTALLTARGYPQTGQFTAEADGVIRIVQIGPDVHVEWLSDAQQAAGATWLEAATIETYTSTAFDAVATEWGTSMQALGYKVQFEATEMLVWQCTDGSATAAAVAITSCPSGGSMFVLTMADGFGTAPAALS